MSGAEIVQLLIWPHLSLKQVSRIVQLKSPINLRAWPRWA